jgi:SAM-dependent methyltransferase
MKAESYTDYVQVNKKHWNAIARHSNPERRKYLKLIRDGYPYLENIEPKISLYLQDIKGKDVIVPQFGDGLVMLACAKKGAHVTGVDISNEQTRLVTQGAQYCGVDIALVEADWQKLPKKIRSNSFDIVVTECGIFIWIRSLEAWMKNAYCVLRKGGRLIVSDFHPLSLCTEEGGDGKSIVFMRSYFDQTPHVRHEKGKPLSIEFTWKLSDIINAAVDAGFHIDRIEEYYVKEKAAKIPLMPTDFLIAATKK